MNNYKFGNKLYELRKRCKLSQSELGDMVGVTNKAVSKWEMGKAKPTIEIMGKLSLIFNVKIEELMEEEEKNTNIHMIVVTGGPCAGKSTALSWIQKEFTQKGYTVLFIGESATELINSGVKCNVCKTKKDFQLAILRMQKAKEELYCEAASKMANKILIVCDRGTLDGKAYVSELDFQYLMKVMNTNEIELRDNYDAVFHLVTAAKGAKDYYTFETNKARTETIEEAAILDDKIISAWTGHPHLRIIDNSTNFEGKMQRLVNEIASFLGEPKLCEVERKYLIEYPNVKELESMNNCEKIEIIQTYLTSDNDEEVRIRQRGKEGNYIYYKTIRKKVSDLKRLEVERRLSKEEYLNLLMNADPDYRQIRKTRYCLMHNKTYYEIDIYPFWKDKALVEVELKDENQKITLPSFLKVIKDVTSDESYRIYSLAKI
jgi:CYTH domain-containing protein/transcriptional regulator with XRE-family HTH domain